MKTLFDADRLTLDDAIQLTIGAMQEHASQEHWSIAFSGGKDSTALVTCLVHLIDAGLVKRPRSLIVQYADTRMELPPLQICAMAILDSLRKRGIETRVVLPPLDERFFVYMLGRGVPPPKNRFRWCTPMLKVLIDQTPWLDWLLLTKRPQNVRGMWSGQECRSNVWLLTSVSDQPSADALIHPLLGCRDLVPVLGLSVEPLIGPLDLTRLHFADGSGFRNALTGAFLLKCKGVNGHPDFWAETQEPGRFPKVDWVIVGGESGSHARPMHPDWVRAIRDQCAAAGVPCFFKQWGEWVALDQSAECEHARDGGHNPGFHTFECDNCVQQRSDGVVYLNRDSCKCVSVYKFGKKLAGRLLDGRTWDEFPKVGAT